MSKGQILGSRDQRGVEPESMINIPQENTASQFIGKDQKCALLLVNYKTSLQRQF